MAILLSTADSMVASNDPTVIYGSYTTMSATNWSVNTAISYIKVDLSGFSSSVGLAILHLYVDSNNNGVIGSTLIFNRVTSSWSESTLNYNNKPSSTTTNQATKFIAANFTGWVEVDVTSIINDMISGTNYGIEITENTDYAITFRTKEYSGNSYTPYIAINPYYVKVGGDDALDGRSWANAWKTINKAATTVADRSTVHIGFGDYVLEPAANKIAPQNVGTYGIEYLPETATTGGGTGTVSVEQNT